MIGTPPRLAKALAASLFAACACFVLATLPARGDDDTKASDGRTRQAISFDELPTRTVGDPPFELHAAASSGLPVEYAIVSGPAVVDGNRIRLIGTSGLVLVRASQPGNITFAPALDAERAFAVEKTAAAPIIQVQPSDHAAALGESTALSVEADGTPPPHFQWRKDGSALPGATSATLNFAALSNNDAGSYDVVVSNASGSVTSGKAVVSVTRRAQTITFQTAAGNTFVGQPIALNAISSSGMPVTFELISGSASLSGGMLTAYSAGPAVVRANQAGDDRYSPAPPADQTFFFSPAR